jgi:hypothetical protein
MSMTSTISTTYSKAAYYTEDGKFYDIDLIDKTYSIDDSYEDPVTNADMLFGATTDFVSAEVDDNGNFAETYNVDSDIAGTEGTIRYTFNSETGSLMNFEIDLGGYSTVYSAEDFSNADDESLALPDLSDYEES